MTCSVTVVLCVTPPPLPVMVSAYLPVVLPTVTVRFDDDVGLGDALLKLASAPLGSPVTVSATGELNPPLPLTVTAKLVVPPRLTVRDPGLALIVKSGVVGADTVTATELLCVSPPLVAEMVTV